jgi:hypothetical protein
VLIPSRRRDVSGGAGIPVGEYLFPEGKELIGKVEGEFFAHAFGRAPAQSGARNVKGWRMRFVSRRLEQLHELSFVLVQAEPVVGKLGILIDGPDIPLGCPGALGGGRNGN